MRVLMVEPGYAPYEKELNGLHEMQAAVGGLIQAIYPFEERVGLVCNEEGLINGMEFNRSVPSGYEGVFGPFFVCGLGDEDFCNEGSILYLLPHGSPVPHTNRKG